MGIEITDLSTLDATRVADTQDLMTQIISEQYPNAELNRGVLHDLVMSLYAILTEGVVNNNTDRIRQSMSLSAIVADPTLADDDLVDSVISNYNVTRKSGAAATGNATIVVTANNPLVIPKNAVFTANGTTFFTPDAHAVRVTGSTTTNANDRVLVSLGGGLYSFSIPLECNDTGAVGAIRRGSRMEAEFEIANLDTIYAESDFSGGEEEETNADLLARLDEGAAIKAWSSRTSVSAMTHAETAMAAQPPPKSGSFESRSFPPSEKPSCRYSRSAETSLEPP
jgi:uncharacterized phage protein gp47/JayE